LRAVWRTASKSASWLARPRLQVRRTTSTNTTRDGLRRRGRLRWRGGGGGSAAELPGTAPPRRGFPARPAPGRAGGGGGCVWRCGRCATARGTATSGDAHKARWSGSGGGVCGGGCSWRRLRRALRSRARSAKTCWWEGVPQVAAAGSSTAKPFASPCTTFE
jgi:hypothetical protein